VAGGPVELMSRYLRTGAFEVLLTHNRWTLVDRSAGDLLDEAVSLGVAVIHAAPFGGGLLAAGTGRSRRYAYHEAPPALLERVRAMEAVCASYSIALPAAALQFSMRDPRIASTVVGASRPERVDELLELAGVPIPVAAWSELEPLAAPPQLWQW
ncbi:MAG: aldo/keto reductase, partial [Actinomycetota bacterium]|nr:aldo/keto reductase [Actinomycetota bacterium]